MELKIPPLHVLKNHFRLADVYFMGPSSNNAVWSLADDLALDADRCISLDDSMANTDGDYRQTSRNVGRVVCILAEFIHFCTDYDAAKPVHKSLGKPLGYSISLGDE